MRIFQAAEYIDGTINAVNTDIQVVTLTSTQSVGGTLRLLNQGVAAEVSAIAGPGAFHSFTILPPTAVPYRGTVVIPGISIGPSDGVWVRSNVIGLAASFDGALEDDYSKHKIGGIRVDGATYAINTYHTVLTMAAGLGARVNITVSNRAATVAEVYLSRGDTAANGSLIERVNLIPGQIITHYDVAIGDAAGSSNVIFKSDTVDVCCTAAGWQIEG